MNRHFCTYSLPAGIRNPITMSQTKREFLRKTSSYVTAGVLGVGSSLAATGKGFSQSGDKPNSLLIIADDLGYHDLSCQGAKDLKTPNLDRLAADGIRFSAGYVTARQCGPSRAGLLTGMHQSHFGCDDNRQDYGLPSKDIVQVLPEQLKALGYTTGIIGKWHVGFQEDEKRGHSTRPGNNPWERGFDYVLKHQGGMSHFFPYREDGWKWMTDRKREPRLRRKLEHEDKPSYLEDLPKNTYLTDIFSEDATDFIKRHKDGAPWFLYLSYNAPHTPIIAPKDKMDKYAHIKDHKRRVLAAMMDSLDDGVGSVLTALKETDQRKRTVVWFMSDNGAVALDTPQWNGSRNDPFSGAKGDILEGGLRVPFMVSWPGTIPGDQIVDDPVISLDILPTSLAAAGKSEIDPIHDGNNLLPWFKREAECPNETIFWTWRSNYSAVRSGKLKEIRNGRSVTAIDGTKIPRHNFVDLASNPTELAGEHALKDMEERQMLSRKLDAWLESVRDDARVLTPGLRK